MSSEKEPIEDFLTVDDPVRGQNFVCISFLSPESVIKNKETFILHEFLKDISSKYDISHHELIDKFDDFKYKNEKTLTDQFNEENDFRTNIRAVKIRGVYDTKKEADFRAKKLQNKDQYHNVFVGEIGYWLPWDPSHSYIDDIDGEYLNKDLNTLMKKYQENQDHKNLHFEEMLKEKTSKTASTEEISQAINDKDDPWLKKVSDSDNNKSDTESEQQLEIKEI
tara:strand:- start:955 stop:1623 length:669 start_codon:yes stop_codon:yes gene_type:complete